MKRIPLTKGEHTIVDDSDFEYLNQWKWHTMKGYAARKDYSLGRSNPIYIYMHRLLADTPEGMITDHINGNKLDNRRGNLRQCTKSQNAMNVGVRKDNKSGYKGVHKNNPKANSKLWKSEIKHNGKRVFLGYFNDPEVAASVYKEAQKKYHGEFAKVGS